MNRIYIKGQVCIGCRLCEMYCRVEHSHSRDLIKAFKVVTTQVQGSVVHR